MPRSAAGDNFKGYVLLEPFHITNGANCEWAFAKKGSEEYFIKRFFAPKYPMSAVGDVEARIRRCEAFEAQQRGLMSAAQKVAGRGGRLVVPIDFFRIDSSYYKVAPKVDELSLAVDEIAELPFEHKMSIMSAVLAAVKALHNAKIVHGDLSPANILISGGPGAYHANVIDFDSSFITGKPPSREDTMGNPPYYSPELLTYLQTEDGDGTKLTTRSDTFALGVVFWEYLYGATPSLESPLNYAAEAVRTGQTLTPPRVDDVPRGAAVLLLEMLSLVPSDRPTLLAVSQRIANGSILKDPEAAHSPETVLADPRPRPPDEPHTGPSRVRKKRLAKTKELPVDRKPDLPETGPPRSRIRSKRNRLPKE